MGNLIQLRSVSTYVSCSRMFETRVFPPLRRLSLFLVPFTDLDGYHAYVGHLH